MFGIHRDRKFRPICAGTMVHCNVNYRGKRKPLKYCIQTESKESWCVHERESKIHRWSCGTLIPCHINSTTHALLVTTYYSSTMYQEAMRPRCYHDVYSTYTIAAVRSRLCVVFKLLCCQLDCCRSLVAFHLYGPVVRRVSRFPNVVFFYCADYYCSFRVDVPPNRL